jgi:hypothetical protein
MTAPAKTVGRLMGAANMMVVFAGNEKWWAEADIQSWYGFQACLSCGAGSWRCGFQIEAADVGGSDVRVGAPVAASQGRRPNKKVPRWKVQ